jgi:cell division septation protein DedD
MIKYLFIFINTISLFIYGLFNAGPITVTNTIPKNLKPGQEVAIEVSVSKGNMSGFAKLQLDIPEGFTVKESDSRGANFSFGDGIAKWVWSSLPTDEVLTVKCMLVAGANMSGAKTIGGKYSYVENNAKVVVEMEPVEVTIGDAVAGSGNNSGGTTTPTETPVTGTPTQATNSGNGNVEPAGAITATRTISYGENEGDFIVSIRINKGLTKGFARYSDDIATDMFAKGVKTEGASFSVSDGKVKFVWVAVPEKEILEISYTMQNVSREVVLNGEYSYLEQNQSKSYNLNPDKMGGNVPLATNTNTQATNTNTWSTGTPTETPNTNTTVAVTPTESQNTNTVATVTPTETAVTPTETVVKNTPSVTETPTVEALPKKEGNVNYMVQIGAFTSSGVTAGKLSRKFSINEKISSEMAGGFSKFMVGDHDEYKRARDHRERMKGSNGVRSAFVVAYNGGKRITVQEALMVSNQKWFK